MFAIYKKELKSYFNSPIGYVLLAFFAAFTGVYFTVANLLSVYSDLAAVFQFIMYIILAVFAPILTMRLMSEELKLKTDQLLLTAPVSPLSIVLGKFLSALTFFAAALSVTLLYGGVTAIYGKPVFGMFLGNIFATLMIAGALISIGLFISSLTESQIVAAFSSFGVIVLLFLLQSIAQSVTNPILSKVLNSVSIYNHALEFLNGIFNFTAIIYYFSIMAIFIFLTVRVIEKKRWA